MRVGTRNRKKTGVVTTGHGADPLQLGGWLGAGLAGAVVLYATANLVLGWGYGIDWLVRIHPDWPATVPGTAIYFILAALGVIAWSLGRHRMIALGCGLALAGCVALRSHLQFDFDGLKMSDGMSLSTKLCFLLVAASTMSAPAKRRSLVAAHLAITTLGLIYSQIGFLFYLFDISFLAEVDLFAMLALPTIACFQLLFVALLLGASRPVWLHLLMATGPGSDMLRLLLPFSLLGPAALGLTARGLFVNEIITAEFGFAILVAVSAWLLAAGLFSVAKWINRVAAKQTAIAVALHDKELALTQAEALAARVQKVTSLGRVAGGVAHDFNNLMTAIQGNLELMSVCDDPAERRRYLREAAAATQRGAALTQKLLCYGGKSVLDPEVLILDRKIRYLEGMLHRYIPAGVELATRLEAGHRRICADRVQLEQAIVSLVTNAQEAIEDLGRIEIETGFGIPSALQDSPNAAKSEKRYIYVRVKDTGHGMDRETLEKVTDPFFTTKSETMASGLGLSMVHGFCKQSAGYLDIESEVGKGTAVTMYFPETAAASADTAIPAPSQSTTSAA